MKIIQSKNHKPRTYEINKVLLSVFDNKRFVINDGLHTLAYFHKDLKKQIHTEEILFFYISFDYNLLKNI